MSNDLNNFSEEQQARFKNLQSRLGGWTPTYINEGYNDVNGERHNPAIRKKFTDIFNGRNKSKFQQMLEYEKNANNQFQAIPVKTKTNNQPVKNKVDVISFAPKQKTQEEIEIERIFGNGGGGNYRSNNYGNEIPTLDYESNEDFHVDDFRSQLLNRLDKKKQQQQHSSRENSIPKMSFGKQNNQLETEEYDKDPLQLEIERIAQSVAENMIKSVLKEYQKNEKERMDKLIEKTFFKSVEDKSGNKFLQKGNQYYKLEEIEIEGKKYTVLKEVKAKRK